MKRQIAFLLVVLLSAGSAVYALPAENGGVESISVDTNAKNVYISGYADYDTDIYFYPESSLPSENNKKAQKLLGKYDVSFKYNENRIYTLCVQSSEYKKYITVDTSNGFEFVSYDAETKIFSLKGEFDVKKKSDVSVYLLSGRKTPENAKEDFSCVAYVAQILTDAKGNYSYDFKFDGKGVYSLYIKCDDVLKGIVLDTSSDISYSNEILREVRLLARSYGKLDGNTVFERFVNAKNEIADEMPVVSKTVPSENTVYVSPLGSDENGNGTFEKPYNSIEMAINSAELTNGRTIYLREGTYYINSQINIENVKNELSTLTFKAYNDEKVYITTGINLSDRTEVNDARIKDSVRGKIIAYSIAGAIDEGYEIPASDLPILTSGETLMRMARWPNASSVHMLEYTGEDAEDGVIDAGPRRKSADYGRILDDRSVSLYGKTGFEFMLADLHPFTWQSAGNMFMNGAFCYQYRNGITVKIECFDPDKRSIRAQDTLSAVPTGAMYADDNTFYFANIAEELDSPGEWYIDTENLKVYIYPENENEEYKLSFGNTDSIFNIENCKNIVFDGINFVNTNARAINVKNSENIVVQGCNFENISNNGVYFQSCEYSGVIYSNFKAVEAASNTKGAVIFYDNTSAENFEKLIPHRNFVQNCVFNAGGEVSVTGVGCIVSHNLFSNQPRNAVTLNYGAENIVEYNEFIAGPTVSEDCGVVYVNGGHKRNLGHHIRYNYIHNSKMNRSGHYTIYLDETASNNYVYGNISKDGSRIHMHGGSENVVCNNLFVGNNGIPFTLWTDSKPTYTTLPCINDSLNFVNTSGETDFDKMRMHVKRWYTNLENVSEWFSYINSNAEKYDKTIYNARYPAFADFTEKLEQRISEYAQKKNIISDYVAEYSDGTSVELNRYLAMPRDNFYVNNVFVDSECGIFAQGEHQPASNMKNNIYFDKNAAFANGDFSEQSVIKNTNPDYENIPFDKIGVCRNIKTDGNVIKTVYPYNNAVIDKESGYFMWSKTLTGSNYKLEIATDNEFENIVSKIVTYKNSVSAGEITLDNNMTYYFRVTEIPLSKSVTGAGAVSNATLFKTSGAGDAESDEKNMYITSQKFYEKGNIYTFTASLCNINEDRKNIGHTTDYDIKKSIFAAALDETGAVAAIKKVDFDAEKSLQRISVNLEANTKIAAVKVFVFSDNLSPLANTVKIYS